MNGKGLLLENIHPNDEGKLNFHAIKANFSEFIALMNKIVIFKFIFNFCLGEYECSAENTIGKISGSVQLIVQVQFNLFVLHRPDLI